MDKEVLVVENGEVVEIDDVVKFVKPYKFEGKEYTEVDLSGLDNIKASDMIEAEKMYGRSGGFSFIPEMSMEYALIIATKASNQPIEFFQGLQPKNAMRVKNKVTSFFFGQA